MYNNKIFSKINNIKVRFHDLLKIQKKRAPKTAIKIEKICLNTKFSYKYIFNFLFILFSFLLKKKSAKYIFHGLKYHEIISLFDPKEVLILASRSEIEYCKKNNYQYHWIGYLYYSAIYFLSKKNNFFLIKSINIIKKIINPNDQKLKYLFLHSSHELSGMILSEIFNDNKYIKTVCIYHAYIQTIKKNLPQLLDINCQYTFVWSENQKNLFKHYKLPIYNLGLPYEIKIPEIISNKIILVGNGIERLDKNFFHFNKICSTIDKNLFTVEYRPHPDHDEELYHCKKYLPSIKINNENKMDLLRKSRKIYIGFASTLLYEASKHENYVIILDTSFLGVYLDFEFDMYFEEKDYSQLARYLNTIRFKMKKSNKKNVKLKKRFMHCLEKINKN